MADLFSASGLEQGAPRPLADGCGPRGWKTLRDRIIYLEPTAR